MTPSSNYKSAIYSSFLILLLSFGFRSLEAQSWQPLGHNGGQVSVGSRNHGPTIATDTSGTPYIAFTDIDDSLTLKIRKFNGTHWTDVGNLGYHLRGGLPCLAVSKTDTPYILFYNYNDNSKPAVMKFDGTAWIQIGGGVPLSPGGHWELSLVLDNNDKIYVAYGAYTSSINPQPGAANIFTFDGTDWIPVGNTAFVQYTSRISLAVGASNELYVGYNSYYNPPNVSRVSKFDGTAWDTVGQASSTIYNMATAPDGTPYVLHLGPGAQTVVDKLVNNMWVQQGSTGLNGSANYVWHLALDEMGIPHVTYSNLSAAVRKYDGSSWLQLGANGFSPTNARDSRLAFGKRVPYIVYATTATNSEVYAMYYDDGLNVPTHTKDSIAKVYPNPVTNHFTVVLNEPNRAKTSLRLTDLTGRIVFAEDVSGDKADINVRTLAKGIYYLYILPNGNTKGAGIKLLVQ